MSGPVPVAPSSFPTVGGGALTGVRIGLVFWFLDHFLGGASGEALFAARDLRPGASHLLLGLAIDVGTALLLGAFVALSLRVLDRRADIQRGLTSGLLGGLALVSYVLYRANTHFGFWAGWRTVLIACGLVYLVVGGAVLARVELWLAARAGRVDRAVLDALFGVLAYMPVWSLRLATDLGSGDAQPPYLTLALALVPFALVCVGLLRRLADRRRSLSAAALGVALILVLAPGLFSARPPALPEGRAGRGAVGPPIVLIVLDTLRADHLGAYGYERDTSPNLDRFAAGATLFERCISPSSWTVPAHASLFTGVYPRTHGAHLSERGGASLELRPEFTTLAEKLGAAGYLTAAAVANPFLTSRNGFDQGFDVYWEPGRHRPYVVPFHRTLASNLARSGPMRRWGDYLLARSSNDFTPYLTLSEQIPAVRRWLEQAGERSLFLFLNAMETHDPFEPPPPHRDRWPGRSSRRINFHAVRTEIMLGELEFEPWLREHLLSQYDGEIANVDHQLGRLFDLLRDTGFFDDAWIIVTSDHGEHFGERGRIWHRTSLYEALVHVPLIVKRPEQRSGERVARPVQLVDVLPTLLRRASIVENRLPNTVDLWQGRDEVFAELYHDSWIVEKLGARWDRDLVAWESGGWKLIESTDGAVEVYDLARDPSELDNLAGAEGDRLVELQGGLAALIDRLPVTEGHTGDRELEEETLERVKSLGYLN